MASSERLGNAKVVAIFAVPVVVMSAFGSLLKFPWSRPTEDTWLDLACHSTVSCVGMSPCQARELRSVRGAKAWREKG